MLANKQSGIDWCLSSILLIGNANNLGQVAKYILSLVVVFFGVLLFELPKLIS